MLSKYLSEIEERLKAATPGPWKLEGKDGIVGGPDLWDIAVTDDREMFSTGIPREQCHANATLIANAPTDLTRLLAIVRLYEEAINDSIARSDDHGDSWCSKPIREALRRADEIAAGSKE